MIHILLPLIFGSGVYLLWRPANLRVFVWLDAFHMTSGVQSLRELADPIKGYVPDWILYSLPDGCWAYALMAALFMIWPPDRRGRVGKFWLIMGVCLIFGFEAAQAFHFVPGYFSLLDVGFYTLGILAAAWAVRRRKEHYAL